MCPYLAVSGFAPVENRGANPEFVSVFAIVQLVQSTVPAPKKDAFHFLLLPPPFTVQPLKQRQSTGKVTSPICTCGTVVADPSYTVYKGRLALQRVDKESSSHTEPVKYRSYAIPDVLEQIMAINRFFSELS